MSDRTSSGFHLQDVLDGDNIPVWREWSYPARRRVRRVAFYVTVVVSLVIMVFPLFWMFSSALRPHAELYTRPVRLLPTELSLEFFRQIIYESKFLRFYMNSIILSTGVVFTTVVASTLGGYGLARIDMSHKRSFARAILLGYMFPPILLAIPMYIMFRQMGILNTYVGVILGVTAVVMPFSLWLMWQFFQSVPYSLEESARMSGASRFRSFYEIALPMAKPGMIAVGVQAYAFSWNAFTIPKILVPALELWPVTVGLFSFTQQNQIFWGQIMAASAMMVIPGFIFVYLLQKYLLQGFRTAGIG